MMEWIHEQSYIDRTSCTLLLLILCTVYTKACRPVTTHIFSFEFTISQEETSLQYVG